ncbi:MAG: hypothetical protein RIQ60_663 [Pseudomonadota bacterium]|jgi:hypothetical protein
MKHQLTHIDPFQAAKLIALLSVLISFPVLLLTALPALSVPGPSMRFLSGSLLALPVVYGIAGYTLALIGAGLYNQLASHFGGIIVHLQPIDDSADLESRPTVV